MFWAAFLLPVVPVVIGIVELCNRLPYATADATWGDALRSPLLYPVWLMAAIALIWMGCWICLCRLDSNVVRFCVVVVCALSLCLPIVLIDAVCTATLEKEQEAHPDLDIHAYSRYAAAYDTASGVWQIIGDSEYAATVYNLPACGYLLPGSEMDGDALYYDQVIWVQDGVYYLGYDYTADGKIDAEDHVAVRQRPEGRKAGKVGVYRYADGFTLTDKDGKNGRQAVGCFDCVVQEAMSASTPGAAKTKSYIYTWYERDPYTSDGAYGDAVYTANGRLADGYVYGFDVAMRILSSYDAARSDLEESLHAYNRVYHTHYTDYSDALTALRAQAYAARTADYTATEGDAEQQYKRLLYEREMRLSALQTQLLTETQIEMLLSSFVCDLTGGTLLPLAAFTGVLTPTALLKLILGDEGVRVAEMLGVDDVVVSSVGQQEIRVSGGKFGEGETIALGTDKTFERIYDCVRTALGLTEEKIASVTASLLGLIGCQAVATDPAYLSLSIEQTQAFSTALTRGLLSLYQPNSSLISPIYAYYERFAEDAWAEDEQTQAAFRRFLDGAARYDRALYAGGVHGMVTDSCLIGARVGDGRFTSSAALSSAEIRQTMWEIDVLSTVYVWIMLRNALLYTVGVSVVMLVLSLLWRDGGLTLFHKKKE